MNASDFKMTKTRQAAKDFGLTYFTNGFSHQDVYRVYQNDRLIREMFSTKFDKKIYAFVLIGLKAENGVALVPNEKIVYEVMFSVNPNKKYYCEERFVLE